MDTQSYVLAPRSPAAIVEDQFVRLFKRCVQCPPVTPACNCAAGQTCSLVSATCAQCQYTVCTGTPTNSGPPVAAIAGGVVGGVFVLAIIIFLALRFRKHRQQEYTTEEPYEAEEWQQAQLQQEKDEQDRFSALRSNRMSTRTVASTASAVSGRASNIIQIAYIPGVTNRAESDHVPPMPPIPAFSGATSRSSPVTSNRTSQAEQFMFLPSDLRNSTYSDYSARSSVAASRASFASTVYRNDAIIDPMPAQAVNLLKPTSVSVRGSTRGSPSISRSSSPPIGSSSPTQPLHSKGSIVGKMAQPRAITVTRKLSNSIKPHGIKAFELDGSDHSVLSSAAASMHQRSGPASPRSNAASTFEYAGSEEDDLHSISSHLVELPAQRTTMLPVIPPINLSPAELSESSRHSSIPRAIQDSMMKAMQINMGPAPGSAPAPDASPFSDAHESHSP